MVLLIIIPFLNGYFIGGIPYFQTNPSLLDPSWTLPEPRGVQVHHAFALDLDAQLSSPPLAAALRCPAAEALGDGHNEEWSWDVMNQQ